MSNIVKLTILAIVIFTFSYCKVVENNKKPFTATLRLIFSIPFVTSDGVLIKYNDSLTMFFYKNIVLYKMPYKRDTFLDEKLIKTERCFSYFVYKQNEQYGFSYDSLNSKANQKRSVDSFLSEKTFAGINIYKNVFKNNNYSLIETITDTKNKTFVEKYIVRLKYDDTYNDTTYLYYSNQFEHINFSLSKELDSLKKMKLFKIRFVFNQSYSSAIKLTLPKRELVIQIKEVPIANSIEITNFLIDFERKYS